MTNIRSAAPAGKRRRRRYGLGTRVIGFLLAIAVIPLVVAGVLLNQSGRVAVNFASNETAFLRPALERAKGAYIQLIESKRDLYYPQVALRVAAMPTIVAVAEGRAPAPGTAERADLDRGLAELLAQTHELAGITVRAHNGEILLERRTESPLGSPTSERRQLSATQPIGDTGAQVQLTFAADAQLQFDYQTLSRTLDEARRIDQVRSALPSSYRMGFLLLVGGVVLLVSLIGLWLGRRFTRRFAALVSGTRRVGAGDLEARVELRGRDELAELAQAFNRMVEELAAGQEQIAYLQRVGAWQDVARKLAHEIKNPLTPIQLAVQQCVSSYKDESPRYRRLLTDTEEIVTEEIANLRRLVDAFRTLGQLPRVAAKPLALADVVEDLHKDPMLIDHLQLEPPEQPVMIRGDRLLLRRVLTNLVENGVHAAQDAGRDGQVVIRWRPEHDPERVRLTVDDNGPGVPENRRDKIFEPYITHKEQGTGLGLTISKKIALEHGGSLSLARESSTLGGARFILILPVASPDDDLSAPVIDDAATSGADDASDAATADQS